ncbi:MAG: hypothetical protein DWH81_01830 [Planctomycetota bacterium]|jgi:hypothetical protein|nr:MAG: hypothetical protein DWH81_01830 [Planctomycetota bacterium]
MDIHSEDPSKNRNLSPLEADIWRVCEILRSVADGFPPESEQSRAIRDAAFAYQAVQFHNSMKKSYEKLRNASGGELTDEMRANLRSHGIDPDAFEDDEPDA